MEVFQTLQLLLGGHFLVFYGRRTNEEDEVYLSDLEAGPALTAARASPP